MGYHVDDCMVRVDRFKPRGKWYDSISVDMSSVYHADSIHDSLRFLIREQHGHDVEQWTYVCLKPYHKHSCPVMLKATDET